MNVLEHIKQLTNTLTPEQRKELANYLEKPKTKEYEESVKTLRGRWKTNFPENFDIDKELKEIRTAWKKKFDFEL